MDSSSASKEWNRELQKALQFLYSPSDLRKSPLVDHFALAGQANPASALRELLIGAIQSLKPDASVPLHNKAWKIYNTLLFRYIEQLSQKEVANDLVVSIRTQRRLESEALQALAEVLSSQIRLDAVPKSAALPVSKAEQPAAAEMVEREQELHHLRETLAIETSSLPLLVEAALQTARPLLETRQIAIELALPPDLPLISVQVPPLRQALLVLFNLFARFAPQSALQITASAGAEQVELCLQARCPPECTPVLIDPSDEADLSRELIRLAGGELTPIQRDEGMTVTLRIRLPVAERIPVLVIDDNADALQLMERYLSGTRFLFIGTSDPETVVKLAEDTSPRLILLDVMLSRVDGWELLGRLREHPSIQKIPVIICTFLPQAQLAMSLGAAAFLRKPISRQALLTALSELLDSPG